jgi:hypothetical protein
VRNHTLLERCDGGFEVFGDHEDLVQGSDLKDAGDLRVEREEGQFSVRLDQAFAKAKQAREVG